MKKPTEKKKFYRNHILLRCLTRLLLSNISSKMDMSSIYRSLKKQDLTWLFISRHWWKRNLCCLKTCRTGIRFKFNLTICYEQEDIVHCTFITHASIYFHLFSDTIIMSRYTRPGYTGYNSFIDRYRTELNTPSRSVIDFSNDSDFIIFSQTIRWISVLCIQSSEE